MYLVEDYIKVRRDYYVNDLSKRQLARKYGCSRTTVSKMLSYSEPPGYRQTNTSKPSLLDPFKLKIKQILEEDKDVHKKQKHTAKRIFDRLVEEDGYTGSYHTCKHLSYYSNKPVLLFPHKEVLCLDKLSHPKF